MYLQIHSSFSKTEQLRSLLIYSLNSYLKYTGTMQKNGHVYTYVAAMINTCFSSSMLNNPAYKHICAHYVPKRYNWRLKVLHVSIG